MDSAVEMDVIDLVLRAREENEAFSALLLRYTPMIGKVIGGFSGSLVSYDEAYAEACIAFHRAVKSYDVSRSEGITFGLYSRICVYRRLCDFVAKRTKEASIAIVDPDSFSQDTDIEEAILQRERVEICLKRVEKLLSKYEYSVFSLYIDGYSTAEISLKLSKDAKSVENAKARVFKRLREAGGVFAEIN